MTAKYPKRTIAWDCGQGHLHKTSEAAARCVASIEALLLEKRTLSYLRVEGIATVGDLTSRTKGELLKIPLFGTKCLNDVIEQLARVGLELKQ